MEHGIINLVIFIGAFLAGSVLIHRFTRKVGFPYTVTVFLVGLILHALTPLLPFEFHFNLSTDMIFFILLPFLLFESALHIKFHQFRLQFKTISFISTFGLLMSVFTVGFLLPLFIGLPLPAAMLFGAVISATDPVAVLALFKTLKVPNRLALLVDGESMFNDGTGVIVFKLVSAFVIGGVAVSSQEILGSLWNFGYVFFGAIVLGMVLGYIAAKIIGKILNDKISEITLTIALALGSFVIAEHYFHVSGVITTVLAGITLGNLGIARFSHPVREFSEEMWDYIAFLANTLVFFYIGFIFKLDPFLANPTFYLATIFVVLLGRAATTYVSFALSNVLPGFRDEPNVPMRWQHLINWGGLRGTIPIILVFTIPETYVYREVLINLTLAVVLFTLAINGTTIIWLLQKLRLHLPTEDEEIISHELALFHIEESRAKLQSLEKSEFKKELLDEISRKLADREERERKLLENITNPYVFEKSLLRYAISIERHKLGDLLTTNRINEVAYFQFDTELDLQEDALEFETEESIRGVSKSGRLKANTSYRKRLYAARRFANRFPVISKLVGISEDDEIVNRYQLLNARLLVSNDVLAYLTHVKRFIKKQEFTVKIKNVMDLYGNYSKENAKMLKEIENKYPALINKYQSRVIRKMIR